MGLPVISLALTAVGTFAQMAGAQQQAQANAAAANYQAQVARNNQIVAEQNAEYALQVGQTQEQAKRQQTAQLEGRIRSAAGASGVDPNFGSPVRLQESAAQVGELDALTIRNNAQRQAYGFRVQGMDYAAEAGLDTMRAQNALTAGNLQSFASIVGGAGAFADKWYKYYGGPKNLVS